MSPLEIDRVYEHYLHCNTTNQVNNNKNTSLNMFHFYLYFPEVLVYIFIFLQLFPSCNPVHQYKIILKSYVVKICTLSSYFLHSTLGGGG